MDYLAVLGDGRLASGSGGFGGDQTIRLWDPAQRDGAPQVLFVADAAITALVADAHTAVVLTTSPTQPLHSALGLPLLLGSPHEARPLACVSFPQIRTARVPQRRHEQAGAALTWRDCVPSTASADVSKSDLVRSAGYVSTKKDGMEPLNLTAFHGALLEANGMRFGTCSSGGKGKQGRSLRYATKIQFKAS